MFSYLAFNYQQSCQFIKNLLFFKLYYFSINPVTGYIEPFKESPLEKMTDEQKEYEAMKLVNAMKNLMDQGVISPAKTDESGKLRPVEHILELVEGQAKNKTVVDSESDDN